MNTLTKDQVWAKTRPARAAWIAAGKPASGPLKDAFAAEKRSAAARYGITILSAFSKAHEEACAAASLILENAGVTARAAQKEWKETAEAGNLAVVTDEAGNRSFVKSEGRAGLLWQQVIDSLPERINGQKWLVCDVAPE